MYLIYILYSPNAYIMYLTNYIYIYLYIYLYVKYLLIFNIVNTFARVYSDFPRKGTECCPCSQGSPCLTSRLIKSEGWWFRKETGRALEPERRKPGGANTI